MIEEFENIIRERGWNQHGIHGIMESIDSRLKSRLPEGSALKLTKFQQKAIHSPGFWRDWSDPKVNHLMIQAATSAGKTLVSELNIIDTLQHVKKAIVLVPLKAMVHERMVQFRHDLENDYYNVYGASSDYMEYDERLLNGDYSVAIIVYEKFFAMLSQGPSKLMQDCDLLVVDELSMLSQEQRGPKLEIALEIIRSKWPSTRIMTLATCDCATTKICRWLNITDPIYSSARPVALEEHIVMLNGDEISRTIPADYESTGDSLPLPRTENHIEVPGYSKDWPLAEKKKNLLLAVLKKIYKEKPGLRLLVFVHSQSQAVSIAKYLREHASELYPSVRSQQGYEEFLSKVKACDQDDDQRQLIDDLLPYGIAYHHAGISTNLRELLEEEFCRSHSSLNVIVATETLTIGVNMPFDAMIMITNKVPRGKDELVSLNMQEYRNYIGRAGRLGQNNSIGQTYLFVENIKEQELYWNSFYNREEILSALTQADEANLAPYYLSLLTNHVGLDAGDSSAISADTLKKLHNQSLSASCTDSRDTIQYQKLAEYLYDAYLVDKVNPADFHMGRSSLLAGNAENSYLVDQFGTHMAPFAFSMQTCIDIYTYFYEGYLHGGLPTGLTKEDIDSDRYLLDILYHICNHKEILNASSLNYPTKANRADRAGQAKRLVLAQLIRIYEEKDENGHPRNALLFEGQKNEAALQSRNHIWCLLHNTNLPDEDDKLKSAMRAILMFYWTKGKQVKDIAKTTGFNSFTRIISGDLERMAEVVSFHLDAIYNCCTGVWNPRTQEYLFVDNDAVNAFYGLQTRVKYGMPRDLVPCANKHIHGLDRKRLLELRQKAHSRSYSPIEYLFTAPTEEIFNYLTPSQYAQLRQALLRRQSSGDGELELRILCDIISKDIGSVKAKKIEDLVHWNRRDSVDFYERLQEIMDMLGAIEITCDGSPDKINWTYQNLRLRIAVLTESNADSEDTARRFEQFFQRSGTSARLLIVPHSIAPDLQERIYLRSGADAVLDHVYFTFLLANWIRMSVNPHTTQALNRLLMDLRGTFIRVGKNNLQHYIPRQKSQKAPADYRLILGNSTDTMDLDQLDSALSSSQDLRNFELLSWGESLYDGSYDFSQCPTILVLDRKTVTSSSSLNRFMTQMRNQDFRNCLLLLTSEEDLEEWNSQETMEHQGASVWNWQYGKIPKCVVGTLEEASQKIQEFLRNWHRDSYLIGISYAHYQERIPDSPSQEDCFLTDCQKLKALADRLKEEYGEHRILFDQFQPAKSIFSENAGLSKSLEAYRQCPLYLLLWNYWAKENKNCTEERKIIAERVKNGEATCIILQQGHDTDPSLMEEDWMHGFCFYSMDEPEEILSMVKRHLRQSGLSAEDLK